MRRPLPKRQSASYIAEIPDGVYYAEDFLDNDGIVDAPIKVALELTSTAPAPFRFHRSEPGLRAARLNLARSTTQSELLHCPHTFFRKVPVNGGTFRPMSFDITEGRSRGCLSSPCRHLEPIAASSTR